MLTVLLYGQMGKQFGRRHKLDISTPGEAIRALTANFPDFRSWLYDRRDAPFRVFAGKEALDETGLVRQTARTLKFIPLVRGAGKFGQVILGAVLIVASFFLPIPGLFQLGVNLVLTGISQLLFAPPKPKGQSERPENAPSYIFDGAVNTTAQGNCVPVLYGELIVGSQVVSTGLSVEQIA